MYQEFYWYFLYLYFFFSSKTEKNLKWNNSGWLEAKIPISYFKVVKQCNVGNSTVSDFRKHYEKLLEKCQKSVEQE